MAAFEGKNMSSGASPSSSAAAAAVVGLPSSPPLLSSHECFNKCDKLIKKMMDAQEQSPLNFEPGDQVWAISDIHVDCRPNMNWIKKLPNYKSDTLIVAGDVCTSLVILKKAFFILKDKFKHVFFVPGNHELWTFKGGPNSIDKFYEILLLCEELGVHIVPSDLGADISIIPIFSWWQVERGIRIIPKIVADFDGNCNWPPSIGDPHNIHNSTQPSIAEFFLNLNQRALSQKEHYRARRFVITFSHFVPDAVHCATVPPELISLLCCPDMLSTIQDLRSKVHVFGHSHVNTDVNIGEVRFVQNALGHTKPTEIPQPEMNLLAVGLNTARVQPIALLPSETSPLPKEVTPRKTSLSKKFNFSNNSNNNNKLLPPHQSNRRLAANPNPTTTPKGRVAAAAAGKNTTA